jgi:hypothetical protein
MGRMECQHPDCRREVEVCVGVQLLADLDPQATDDEYYCKDHGADRMAAALGMRRNPVTGQLELSLPLVTELAKNQELRKRRGGN